MSNCRKAVGIFVLCALAGCSAHEIVRHYTGMYSGTSDVLIEGQGNPWRPVEATYSEYRDSARLYTYHGDIDRRDTLLFYRTDSGWRWAVAPKWRANIRRTPDSLIVEFGWGFGGESFYLKQD